VGENRPHSIQPTVKLQNKFILKGIYY